MAAKTKAARKAPKSKATTKKVGAKRADAKKCLRILVDPILHDSVLVGELRQREVELVSAGLRVGHLLVTAQTVVHYWREDEFRGMIADRELFHRIPRIAESGGDQLIVIESSDDTLGNTTSPASRRGALVHLAAIHRIPVFETSSSAESADLIFAMANQMQFGLGYDAPVDTADPAGVAAQTGGSDSGTPEIVQATIVRALPGLTETMARDLRRAYGSLSAIFAADVRDLMKIDGIGPKKAQRLHEYFNFQKPRRRKA